MIPTGRNHSNYLFRIFMELTDTISINIKVLIMFVYESLENTGNHAEVPHMMLIPGARGMPIFFPKKMLLFVLVFFLLCLTSAFISTDHDPGPGHIPLHSPDVMIAVLMVIMGIEASQNRLRLNISQSLVVYMTWMIKNLEFPHHHLHCKLIQ